MATMQLFFVIAGLVCFLISTFQTVPFPRFHFVPAGLACLTVAYLLGGVA